jgi:glycosyltransferase involved in cell wall biosynthesis
MVHYRDSAEAGGSLRVGEAIANHLDPARVRAELVFTYGGPGPVTASTRVSCHFINASGPRDFSAWPRARALFQQIDPDVIHFQDGVVWLRLALTHTSYRKIFHVHGRYERRSAEDGRAANPFRATTLLRAYLSSTQAHICITEGARQALINLGWTTPDRSLVVYNAIDIRRFRPSIDKTTARTALGLPSDVRLLGIVCRLVREKGCADLLSLIARLSDQWHGVICGDGPQRRELEARAARLSISNRIHFLGSLDDVRPVYDAIDAYAFLSSYEPFGLVLAEAMAAGVPVFGVLGDGEYLEPQYPLVRRDTAVMISGDRDVQSNLRDSVIDELANRLEHFNDHSSDYLQMIERARQWVGQCFSASVQAEAMTRVYESLCGGSRDESLTDWYQSKRDAAARLLESEHEARAAAVA